MDGKTIISYSLSGRKDALLVTRKIYGYKDASNNGQYTYKREGILSSIPYSKLGKGVFMVDTENADEVIKRLISLKIKKMRVMDMKLKKERN